MSEVGKVEYKAKINTDNIDRDIDETESKIKKVGSKIDEAFEKAGESASKAGEKAKQSGNEIGESLDKASSSADYLANSLDKVSDGNLDDISDEAKDAKQELNRMGDEAKDAFNKAESGAEGAKQKTDDFSNSVSKSHSILKTLGSGTLTVAKGIGTAFVGMTAAAGAGIAAVVKMGVEYNSQMQSYQTAFATMLGDAEKAQALTDNLKTLAAKTPLAMTDLADASKILLAFGSSAEALPDQLKRLGDVSLGNAEALGTMATAFGRVQSNGYASLEEINMMIDQGFNPLQIIAEKTGETMSEVRDRVSAGEVSFEELNDALITATESGGQFYNAMENQSKTFEGQMSTLKDNLAGLSGALTKDLFDGLAQTTLPMVNDWLDQLMTAAQEGGIEGAIEAGGGILSEMITAFLNGAPSFIETATSLINSFLQGINDNMPAVQAGASATISSLITGFFSMAPNLVETAINLLDTFLQSIIDNSGEMSEGAVELIITLANGIISLLPKIIEAAVVLVSTLVSEILSHLPDIVSTAFQLVLSFVEGLLSGGLDVASASAQLVAKAIRTFRNTDWSSVGSSIVSGIISGITGMASRLFDKAKSLAKQALSTMKSALGIHSPSKVMKEEVGEQITAGIAEGMEDYSKLDKSAFSVSRRVATQISYDMNLPNTQELLGTIPANLSGTYTGNQVINVPLYIDGREVARATAWRMGEQLSWEEM